MGRINILAVVLLICTLFSTYTGWRLITPAKMRFPLNLLAWAAVVSLWTSFLLPILLRRAGFDHPVVERVNRLSPHIVALTGDLADKPAASLRNDVAPLSGLAAKYGCFFVTGNHENYSGVKEWISETKRLGFTALINEHEIVRQGKGRRFSKHVSSPKAAVAGAQETDFKILLAHQPKNIFEAAESGFDLQLSGHTHGGQFLPWKYAVGLNQPYLSGLHKFKETQIYVSRGTGYWGPPLRLGAPSEISLIKLMAS